MTESRALELSVQPSIADVLVSFPARLACYAVIAFALVQVLFIGLLARGTSFIGAENGPVEMAQVYLALFASACLFYAAYRCRRGRAGLITCAAMVGYAAARESDSIFETLLFDDAYKYLVGLPLFLVAVTALLIDRRRVVREAMWLVRQPAITLFALGGIYLCTFCQVLDRPDMWTSISSLEERTQTKAMVEEFAELFAYAILAFAGIEALAMAHRLDSDVESDSRAIARDNDETEEPRDDVRPRIAA
ncbi:hypothetical protein [Planctomycetes bacterium K23_9]|uniref:Uncharacterized protein n=1 Tax=Stieleria marina TaxID=1930275 RepID=A0A517NTG3_9BACT|nr:hypothetical protein K239x_23670 [Planctomycetes bacterium K23_9]